MGWSEVEKPAVSADSDGTQRTSRRFRVWDASPETVLSDPGAIHQDINNPIGLPGYNSNFPGFPSLRLDRYEISNDKPIFDAVAYYSNDRRFIFPTNPNAEPDLALWSGSFEPARFELMYARMTRATISGPVGTPPVDVLGWDIKSQPVTETRMKFGRTVLNETNLAIGLQSIRENNNKLQNIGGVWYLFKAGNFRQPTPLSWEVTYSFILDEGTKTYTIADPALISPELVIPSTTLQFPSLFGTSQWVRPPYCDSILRQLTADVPQGSPPYLQYVAVCPFDVSAGNGMGWQTLPGLGL